MRHVHDDHAGGLEGTGGAPVHGHGGKGQDTEGLAAQANISTGVDFAFAGMRTSLPTEP